jgi:hypothetical protein
MALGYAHLFTLPQAMDSRGSSIPLHQFTFNTGGNAYARVFNESELLEFLGAELGVVPEVLNAAMDDLHTKGNATIPNLELTENEAAANGLEEVGVDY